MKNLNAVVFARVMRGGNHHARVIIVCFDKVCHGGGGYNAEQKHICTDRAKPRRECRLQHFTRSAGIHTNHHARAVV